MSHCLCYFGEHSPLVSELLPLTGAQACAIVFSTTDRQSFQSIERWKKKVEFECGEIPTALVQNKMDLIRDSVVGRSEVNNLVRLHKWKLFKTSVKDNVNVDNGNLIND